MTKIYLPIRKEAEPLDTVKIYELAKQGLRQTQIADAMGISRGGFSRKFNNQTSALNAFWKGKQEFETGIPVD